MMELETIPCRMSHTREREVEGELLLFYDKNKPGCSLNDSARAVWELCDGSRTLGGIADQLGERFEVPAAAFVEDIGYVLQKLVDSRMISLIEAPKQAPQVTVADGAIAVHYCYRDFPEGLIDAPLDHPHIEKALEIVRQAWPEGYEHLRQRIVAIHPLIDPSFPDDDSFFLHNSGSHSAEEQPGEMWSTVNCSMMLADNLVHEAAHIELFEHGVYKESATQWVLNPSEELYVSPVITHIKRPMTAVLHGVYAFAAVAELDLLVLESKEGEQAQSLRRRIVQHFQRLDQGMDEIRPNLRLDDAGQEFFRHFEQRLKRLRARAVELSVID